MEIGKSSKLRVPTADNHSRLEDINQLNVVRINEIPYSLAEERRVSVSSGRRHKILQWPDSESDQSTVARQASSPGVLKGHNFGQTIGGSTIMQWVDVARLQ